MKGSPSANRVTIISDYFISIDYTRLFTIMHDYLRLFHCENPNDYSTLLHYLQKDDYSTYCTTIISLIFSGTYYCDYCDYSTIVCIIFIANYYIYYFTWVVLLQLYCLEPIICIMHIISRLCALFVFSSIIQIIFFQCFYTNHFIFNTLYAFFYFWPLK